MPIKLVSDSTCEIPLEVAKRLGIEIVPLYIHFEDEILLDRYEIPPQEFYGRIKDIKKLPHTSEATEEDFLNVFKKWVGKGYDILTITMSRKQSKTYLSAVRAKETMEKEGLLNGRKIVVYDTLLTSFTTALLNYEIVDMINSGYSMESILLRLDEIKSRMKFYFTVPSLKFLMLGGRIGRAQAMIGSFFNINPILTLEDGIVAPVDKIRGHRKDLIKWIKKRMNSELPPNKPITVGIGNVDNPDDAAEVKRFVEENFEITKIYEFNIGSIIGVHVGPGTVGIAYYITNIF